MRPCDIKQGTVYRLKNSPTYGYVKVLCVLKPKQKLFYKDFYGYFRNDENKNNFYIVRVIHSIDRNFDFGIMRDFKPTELIKDNK